MQVFKQHVDAETKLAVGGIAFGTHAIAVQFVNDRYRKDQFDRNLYLDALRVI
ncbi:MAG TPA: carbohydrate-binding domain-containing protein [Desulfobacterales bacterium]